MGYIVTTPEIGRETSEGAVREWLVAEGDAVEVDEPLVEIESGERNVTVKSREAGTLRRTLIEEGERCAPGDPVGVVTSDAFETDTVEFPERNVVAHLQKDLSGRIEAGSFEWGFDITETFGGSGGPTPIDFYLGSLSACLASSIGIQADIRDVELTELSVQAAASPAEGSVESLSVRVTIDADADTETVKRIVENGERTCHVAELLREDVPLDFAWERPD